MYHKKGDQIYPGMKPARLLVMRLENLSDCVSQAIQEFLGIKVLC
jgi:hypothetical protein